MGSKLHADVDTLSHLLVLRVTPANAPELAQVAELADAVRDATGNTVEAAFVARRCTGPDPAEVAAKRESSWSW